jgi:hypothetical protein
MIVSKKQALMQIPEQLAGLLEFETREVNSLSESQWNAGDLASGTRPDLLVRIGPFRFVVEYKGSGAAGPVSQGIHQLQKHVERVDNDAIPLVVVPYMGDVGRDLCRESSVNWMDLSGNAQIVAPGLRIRVEGRPNRFRRVGRPLNVFAPKSSRISRTLLIHRDEPMAQRDLALASDVGEGFTSRIIRRLQDQGLAERYDETLWRATDPDLLLDAWHERYDFHKHDILAGHCAARSGEELLSEIVRKLQEQNIDYAATGLAAAWLYTHFASFRIATVYLKARPSSALLSEIGFQEEPRGANLWFVVPNDEGVFHGQRPQEGIWCAHPVQVYLDLKAHPERAEEAAAEHRRSWLKWD